MHWYPLELSIFDKYFQDCSSINDIGIIRYKLCYRNVVFFYFTDNVVQFWRDTYVQLYAVTSNHRCTNSNIYRIWISKRPWDLMSVSGDHSGFEEMIASEVSIFLNPGSLSKHPSIELPTNEQLIKQTISVSGTCSWNVRNTTLHKQCFLTTAYPTWKSWYRKTPKSHSIHSWNGATSDVSYIEINEKKFKNEMMI